MRSVNFRAPWGSTCWLVCVLSGSSGSFVCVRSVPVRPGCRRDRSCAFGPFPSSLRDVAFVWLRSVDSRAPCGSSAGVFGPLPCTLGVIWCVLSIHVNQGVVGFGRLRSVNSRASVGCVGSFPVRPGGRRCRSGAFDLFPCALGVLGSVRALGTFPSALEVVGFVGVCSVVSRTPWVSSSSFLFVRSIHVRPGFYRVRSCAFRQFPCAVGDFGFFRVRSLHSRGSWGSFGYFRSIPVRRWGRSDLFGPCPCSLEGVRFVRVLSVNSRAP